MVAPYAVAPWLGQLVDGWAARVAAIAFVIAGVAFGVWAKRALGSAFTPFPRPNTEGDLSTGGPYAYARHPIYTGMIVSATAWSLLWQSLAAGVLTALLFAFFDLKSRREERWLEEKFADYAEYRRRVKRFIPYVY